ncbi:MAG: hypothetical protein ACI83P_002130 [Janthinobacterium sp.]|jgi:hypothetical protein
MLSTLSYLQDRSAHQALSVGAPAHHGTFFSALNKPNPDWLTQLRCQGVI